MKNDLKISLKVSHEPTVTEISACRMDDTIKVKGLNHVSLYFPHSENLLTYEVKDGKRQKFWASWPTTQERALEVVRRDGRSKGLTQAHNVLYIVNDDIPAYEESMERTPTNATYDMRLASLNDRLDSGDNGLMVFHDAMLNEVFLYRIKDGELLWYWASSNISRARASQIAERERLRAELSDDALHFERIESLPKSAFKQPTYSSLQGPVLNESA